MEIEIENDVQYLCEECYQAQPLDIQIVIDAYTIGYNMAHKDPDFKKYSDFYQKQVKELFLKIKKYNEKKELADVLDVGVDNIKEIRGDDNEDKAK